MSTVLIASLWLVNMGTQLSVHDFSDGQACRLALAHTSSNIQEQVRSNLVVPHNSVRIDWSDDRMRAVLRTPIGREVARLQCLQVE